MAVADFEFDFARNPIPGSATWFFIIILKLIFTAIFEIKNKVKQFLGTKKISFSKPDFYKPIHIIIRSFYSFHYERILIVLRSMKRREASF